jgi:hypothetical protein
VPRGFCCCRHSYRCCLGPRGSGCSWDCLKFRSFIKRKWLLRIYKCRFRSCWKFHSERCGDGRWTPLSSPVSD